ncbi:MAG: trypsin-like peptidase domain-containing protein [Nitrospirae bacterium]|nr:trypsin-like peptidase domain-containing protein [Nitrospirota bacterium]
MKTSPGNAQHQGTRPDQQDSLGFSDFSDASFVRHGGVMAALADGMGGMALGRQASHAALQAMLEGYMSKRPDEAITDALHRALILANGLVASISGGTDAAAAAGTTMAACVIHNAHLYWISAGDSRIYLLRNGALTQINTDHTYENELMNDFWAGDITKEEIYNDPDRFALTSYLGLPELKAIDRNVRPYPLSEGDTVILCSDGLYNSLTAIEMRDSITADPQVSAERLVETAIAKQRPNQDNTSAAILSCQSGGSGSFLSRFMKKIASLIIVAVMFSGVVTSDALADNLPVKRMKDSTVRIIGKMKRGYITGSGFVIGGGQYVVTNWHVARCIEDGCELGVAVRMGDFREVTVVRYSAIKDIAILKVSRALDRPSVELVSSDKVEDAQTVYAIGFPGAADTDQAGFLEPKITKGIISAKVTNPNGVKMYQTDTPINPGNSGGPLFNDKGHVVGINTAKVVKKDVQGIGWAVQVDELVPELRAAGINYSEGNPAVSQQEQPTQPQQPQTPAPTLAPTPEPASTPAPVKSPRKAKRAPAAPKVHPDNKTYYIASASIGAIAVVVISLILIARKKRKKIVPANAQNTGDAAASRPERPLLTGVSGEYTGAKIPLHTGHVIIGRDPRKANLVFMKSSDMISSVHCKVGYDRPTHSFFIEDCGSTNGTFLIGGERLSANKKYYVKSGTKFYLSDRLSMFELGFER